VLGGLLDSLCQRLERRDRGAAVLHLHLRLVTRDMHTRSLQLPGAMRDAKVLRTLLLLDLESHQPPAGIDRVTVIIDPTPGRIVQESLLTRALPAPEQVSTLLARLGALMGDTRCGSPVLVDSHRPGAFTMGLFCVTAPRAPLAAEDSSHRHTAKADIPPACLRRFRLPIPVRVLMDGNRPTVVNTDRPGLSGGRVQDCAGPWRTSGEWWKTCPEQGASGLEALRGRAGWNRDEWDVVLGDGGRYRIFEDRDSGRWFMEAVVD
jgi:protein ImuB